MAPTVRAVPTVVVSVFFTQLEMGIEPWRDPKAVYAEWVALFARESNAPYEKPEYVKMRQDLADVGPERFASEWQYLLGVYDAGAPGELHQNLRRIFAPSIADGFARRARHTGNA